MSVKVETKNNTYMSRNIIRVLSFVLLSAAMASCGKTVPGEGFQNEKVQVRLNMTLSSATEPTRSTSAYTTATAAEKKIEKIACLVFNQYGGVEVCLDESDFTISVDGSGNYTASLDSDVLVAPGTKTFRVFVNGGYKGYPIVERDYSQVETWADMRDDYLFITRYAQRSGTFAMYASTTVDVTSSTTVVPLSLTLQRRAARVSLVSLKNSLSSGQAITSAYAFLADVQPLTYWWTDCDNAWLLAPAGKNYVGSNMSEASERPYVTTDISWGWDGAGAFNGSAACTLSSLANGSTDNTVRTLYGFASSPSQERTPWLVVAAVINGGTYYYNVPLDPLVANTAYTVSMDITALGTTIPCTPNEAGTFTATASFVNWTTGTTIDKTF